MQYIIAWAGVVKVLIYYRWFQEILSVIIYLWISNSLNSLKTTGTALFSRVIFLVAHQITAGNIVRAFAFETHLKLSELAKLNTNEIKFIPPTELVCNLYLLIREDLCLG